jgi:hypothetical protein
MNPAFVDLRDNRIHAARAFSKQFNRFEWKYLCSHQWFLTRVGRALDTGDFLSLQLKAEETLVNDRIRRQTATMDDEVRRRCSASGFDQATRTCK